VDKPKLRVNSRFGKQKACHPESRRRRRISDYFSARCVLRPLAHRFVLSTAPTKAEHRFARGRGRGMIETTQAGVSSARSRLAN